VVDAVGVEEGSAALDAVDFVALAEQKFGEVGAVLAGYAGDEGFFGHDDFAVRKWAVKVRKGSGPIRWLGRNFRQCVCGRRATSHVAMHG